jgi:chromosome segregation ATPase
MSEDTTQDFPKLSPFEERVLSEFAALRSEFHNELTALRSEFHNELTALRSEFHNELTALRSEFRSEIEALRSEFRSELNTVNARLTLLEDRMTRLEEKVETRLYDTRPIWESVQASIAELKDEMKRLNIKFDKVIKELYEMRTDITILDERVTQLENLRPQP